MPSTNLNNMSVWANSNSTYSADFDEYSAYTRNFNNYILSAERENNNLSSNSHGTIDYRPTSEPLISEAFAEEILSSTFYQANVNDMERRLPNYNDARPKVHKDIVSDIDYIKSLEERFNTLSK